MPWLANQELGFDVEDFTIISGRKDKQDPFRISSNNIRRACGVAAAHRASVGVGYRVIFANGPVNCRFLFESIPLAILSHYNSRH